MAPKPFRFPRPSLEDMRPLIESLYGPNGPDAQNDPSALLIPQTIEQLYADVDFMRGARFAIAPGENETACEGGLVTVDNRIAFQFSFMGRGLSVSLATLENTEKSMIFLKTTWNVVTGKGKAGKEQARAHGLGSRTGKERAPPLPDTIYMPDDDDEPSAYVPTLGRIKSGEHTDMYDGRNLRVSVRHKGYQPLSMTPNALSVLEVIYHTVEGTPIPRHTLPNPKLLDVNLGFYHHQSVQRPLQTRPNPW
ncbi:hypothetical protein BOTBODRAFT_42067 [Botryobasidium botryosum FD-172 SS1]|uniref:Uncharacterized protein n=1 Tax=Botryobasidium botryosum (strain FD-172 SS1) TaxID=930990 RepID=A0A067N4X8_BOTB1|nr:hypothetical protein BOTBODRAFT_42067 [Botryobasidium botryosum FD-172 SS1]